MMILYGHCVYNTRIGDTAISVIIRFVPFVYNNVCTSANLCMFDIQLYIYIYTHADIYIQLYVLECQ